LKNEGGKSKAFGSKKGLRNKNFERGGGDDWERYHDRCILWVVSTRKRWGTKVKKQKKGEGGLGQHAKENGQPGGLSRKATGTRESLDIFWRGGEELEPLRVAVQNDR